MLATISSSEKFAPSSLAAISTEKRSSPRESFRLRISASRKARMSGAIVPGSGLPIGPSVG